MSSIPCPKCEAPMHTRRRNGVVIEQCVECRGIFLDVGELEQLIGAESSFLGEDQAAVRARSRLSKQVVQPSS
jgi:Zn-finger nucleic acid-binding protein